MLKLVKCINERKVNPKQLKVGSNYYVDMDSIYKDGDDSYIHVYKDKKMRHHIGFLRTSHFEAV